MTTAGNPVSCFVRFTAWNQGRLTSVSYTNWYLKWQKIDKIRFTLSPIMATKGSSFIITSHKQPEDKTRSIPVNGVTWKNLRLQFLFCSQKKTVKLRETLKMQGYASTKNTIKNLHQSTSTSRNILTISLSLSLSLSSPYPPTTTVTLEISHISLLSSRNLYLSD